MNRILEFILLVVTVILYGCNVQKRSIATETPNAGEKLVIEEADASLQWKANECYHKITQVIGKKVGKDPDAIECPDFFGGGYTDERGKLILLIKGNRQEGERIVKNILGGDDSVVEYHSCRYSLQELTNIAKTISDNFSKAPQNVRSILSEYYLDEKNNKVVVGLNELNSENMELFKKYIVNHDAVEFKSAPVD